MNSSELKAQVIAAGYTAVEQLIKVAKEDIIKPDAEDELAADKLKNAAATKKLCIFDAFDILNKIESEQEELNLLSRDSSRTDSKQGFAEQRARK
jgi:hypothetical protein|tara:strand:- start:2317 stop:2601 length:285 start_codon:yes stop_codon:yes gene_type:complete